MDLIYICDLSEQKQPFGWVLTNPPHVTPLRPGSTVIDRFSKLVPQRIAVEIGYLLVYIALENPSINMEPGRNGVMCGGFVKMHPHAYFCSKRSHLSSVRIISWSVMYIRLLVHFRKKTTLEADLQILDLSSISSRNAYNPNLAYFCVGFGFHQEMFCTFACFVHEPTTSLQM